MITVNNQPAERVSDRVLLEHLGFGHYEAAGETTLEDCLLPMDESINIGYYNNHLIICDDYLLSDRLERLKGFAQLSDYERTLSSLFPQSEILTTSCHSGINLHMYTLIQNDERKRFKAITSESPVMEYGELLEEEKKIYAQSAMINGKRVFKNGENTYDCTEDQLMEAFTFGVAKRHLGVMISTGEDEQLMSATIFRKYRRVGAITTSINKAPIHAKPSDKATEPRQTALVIPIGTAPRRSLLQRFMRKLGLR